MDIPQFFVGIAVYSKKLLVEIPHLGAWIEPFEQLEGHLGCFNTVFSTVVLILKAISAFRDSLIIPDCLGAMG
jgi:hypothetical protein